MLNASGYEVINLGADMFTSDAITAAHEVRRAVDIEQ